MTRALASLLPIIVTVLWISRHAAAIDRWPWWKLAALPSLVMLICIIILITHDTWIGGTKWPKN